jgi:threonine/homoserine/homoserine lactone efflux protein
MSVQQLLPFLAVVAMITVTPGPDTALVVRNTLKGTLRDGVLTALGCSMGLLVWGIAAALGLATLMSTSASLFGLIRILGGVYLICLGLRMLWSARHALEAQTAATAQEQPERRPLLAGLLTDLLNPKAAAFFTALLPQFVTSGDQVLTTTLLLAAIAAFAAFFGFFAYAMLAARARAVLGRASLRRWLDRVTGMVLLGLGMRMLAREVRT